MRIELGTKAFAGDMHLIVWLNGAVQYQGLLTGEPGKHKTVEARLKQGWNVLVFKSNHRTWQWQTMVDVVGVGEDKLDDLRYATSPPPAASAK